MELHMRWVGPQPRPSIHSFNNESRDCSWMKCDSWDSNSRTRHTRNNETADRNGRRTLQTTQDSSSSWIRGEFTNLRQQSGSICSLSGHVEQEDLFDEEETPRESNFVPSFFWLFRGYWSFFEVIIVLSITLFSDDCYSRTYL
jgi:hypothetical protein